MGRKAQVVLDSVFENGTRLTTMALTYERFIHSEFMTHRAFSRNASSSRAIPIAKMIEAVERDPATPVRWGLNGKGMQDHGEMTPFGQKRAYEDWMEACRNAVATAKRMAAAPEPCHKQIVNRILEPFSHITVLVTATEWQNFFDLRCHPDADPTIRALAETVRAAYEASKPDMRELGDWHLPFIVPDTDVDNAALYALQNAPNGEMNINDAEGVIVDIMCRVSVARCARVSYLNHDYSPPTIAEDLALFDRLMASHPQHASPAEHQATPDERDAYYNWRRPKLHANFKGWQQYRQILALRNRYS